MKWWNGFNLLSMENKRFRCINTYFHDGIPVFIKGQYYKGELCGGTNGNVWSFVENERNNEYVQRGEFMLQTSEPDEDYYLYNTLKPINFTYGK